MILPQSRYGVWGGLTPSRAGHRANGPGNDELLYERRRRRVEQMSVVDAQHERLNVREGDESSTRFPQQVERRRGAGLLGSEQVCQGTEESSGRRQSPSRER